MVKCWEEAHVLSFTTEPDRDANTQFTPVSEHRAHKAVFSFNSGHDGVKMGAVETSGKNS